MPFVCDCNTKMAHAADVCRDCHKAGPHEWLTDREYEERLAAEEEMFEQLDQRAA